MAGFLLWLEPASPHRYIVRVGGAWGTGPANKWHWSVRISDPRMVRVAMRRSSQVLLPMTDSLMSIPQPFSYLTRAVSVGTTLSMSCSYLTRAVSVGIVFWSLFWNPRRSDMMSRMCRPYLFSTTAFLALQPSLIVPSISGIYDRSPLVQSVVALVVFLVIEYDPWSVCTLHMPWHTGVFVLWIHHMIHPLGCYGLGLSKWWARVW